MKLSHNQVMIGLFILYIIAMTALMIWQGIGIAPDRYAFVLLFGALLVRRTRTFLLDWIPFLFILLSYDFLRGFADNLSTRVHTDELITAERFLFGGQVPTLWLQQHLYVPGQIHWYDIYATFFYFLHFALPLGFGYLVWLSSRARFRQFVIAIVLLSYAGWITFLTYPAAPPWWAKDHGHLPGVTKILDQTLGLFPTKYELPTVYHNFNPNPVAAMPSLHAAYPMLVFLFALSFWGLRALWFVPYLLSVFFSIVYLGEHYVVDIIGGVIFAVVFFLLTKLIYRKIVPLIKTPKQLVAE